MMNPGRCFGLLATLFLASCAGSSTDVESIFDGRQVCLNEGEVRVFSTSMETTSVDDDADELMVTYRSGDRVFDRLKSRLGTQPGGIDYLLYSLTIMDESELGDYLDHDAVHDAFALKGSFEGAEREEVAAGMFKVVKPSEPYSWQVFRESETVDDSANELWIGSCVQLGQSVKCSYSREYENYLLEVELPEPFLMAKSQVMSAVERDIERRLFCG